MKNIYERIAEYNKFGSRLGLERMNGLCEILGNPHNELRVIHVAGTNGKGSVCRYIYEVLRALGYSAGIYMSPFVSEFGERMEVDGCMISEAELSDVADEVFAAADIVARTDAGTPTEFEVVTAMAFQWFARKKPDFVILEVGLGGRGDSTNVVRSPLVSVITSISIDHTDRLGNTIEEIAAEKAGIIKEGCPVVCGATGEAARVIARRAYDIGAPLIDAAKYATEAKRRARSVWDLMCEKEETDVVVQVVDAVIDGTRYSDIGLAMAGAHQADNAVIALTAIECLRRRGAKGIGAGVIRTTADGVRAGMRRAHLPGRFEVFRDGSVPIILDGAHNASGAAALAAAVRGYLSGANITTVIGVLSDKDHNAILRQIYWFSDHIFLTKPPNDRALEPAKLAENLSRIKSEFSCNCGDPSCLLCSSEADSEYTIALSPENALKEAISYAQKNERGAVVVCGSLYLISAIRKLFI